MVSITGIKMKKSLSFLHYYLSSIPDRLPLTRLKLVCPQLCRLFGGAKFMTVFSGVGLLILKVCREVSGAVITSHEVQPTG
jgi:hypothetical protein